MNLGQIIVQENMGNGKLTVLQPALNAIDASENEQGIAQFASEQKIIEYDTLTDEQKQIHDSFVSMYLGLLNA